MYDGAAQERAKRAELAGGFRAAVTASVLHQLSAARTFNRDDGFL